MIMKQFLLTFARKVIRRLRLYKNRTVQLRRKWLHRPQIFEDGYSIVDNTLVTLYTDKDDQFLGYLPRVNPAEAKPARHIKAALIAVAKNEEDTARDWFFAVMSQTRLPDEICVVDTGSSDGTICLLKQLAEKSSIPFQVIEAPGTNISQGRNLAVRSCHFAYIAVTDFGTKPRRDWLENLLLPFELDPETDVSGGWYDAVGESGEPYRWRKWISLLGKNPQDILSPAVSIAFTRQAWERVGGYPEWLSMTGEDTYFDLELKRTCRNWAFCPAALVDWEAPDSILAYWKKMYRWSIGDGETGMRGSAYWYAAIVSSLTLAGFCGGLFIMILGAFIRWPVFLALGGSVLLALFIRSAYTGRKAGYSALEVILVIGILTAQALGYIRGAARRNEITRRRLKMAKGFFFILAGIPVDDTGGGARSTQLSLELLRRQQVVCYINKYPKSESVDLQLSIRHPNLLTYPIDQFSVKDFLARYDLDLSQYKVGVIVELPHSDWLPLIDMLQSYGARLVYDLIDEWDSKLGEGWYRKELEIQTTRKAVALTATAPVLKTRLEEMTGRPVVLLPNAVNLNLFDCRKSYPRPVDLIEADLVITYIGALYGNWFDWELLADTARAYPRASIVVIGDYRGQCQVDLPNLHFLGLKPQTSLPSYLSHSNVAIIPWKVSDITLATSPLKLYEYLAMHMPVVVQDLPTLRDVPAVYRARDREEFIENIQRAAKTPVDIASVDKFLAKNSWEARVTQLIQLMNFRGSGSSL